MEHVFLKKVEGKFVKCSQEEAEQVRLPIEDYISVERWNRVVDAANKYWENQEKYNSFDNGVLITKEEYNGFQNALRIIRERALQQIEKSQADEHGYRLLRADFRKYEHETGKAWLVTKSTPYSSKMGVEQAKFMIAQDLKSFYEYDEDISYEIEGAELRYMLTAKDICAAIEQVKIKPIQQHEGYLLENSSKGKTLYEVFKRHDCRFGFEISKISINYSSGTYEVSYWATDMI